MDHDLESDTVNSKVEGQPYVVNNVPIPDFQSANTSASSKAGSPKSEKDYRRRESSGWWSIKHATMEDEDEDDLTKETLEQSFSVLDHSKITASRLLPSAAKSPEFRISSTPEPHAAALEKRETVLHGHKKRKRPSMILETAPARHSRLSKNELRMSNRLTQTHSGVDADLYTLSQILRETNPIRVSRSHQFSPISPGPSDPSSERSSHPFGFDQHLMNLLRFPSTTSVVTEPTKRLGSAIQIATPDIPIQTLGERQQECILKRTILLFVLGFLMPPLWLVASLLHLPPTVQNNIGSLEEKYHFLAWKWKMACRLIFIGFCVFLLVACPVVYTLWQR